MKLPNARHLVVLICGWLLTTFSLWADNPPLRGSLSNLYKLRTTGAFSDQDIVSLFTLDIGDLPSGRFSGSLQVGGVFDIDGNQGGPLFGSAYSSFSNRSTGRVYYAYFDGKDLGPVALLRAGRQHRYEFESLYFDGASVESKPFHKLTFSTFGGIPVHLFENQIGIDPGDWLVGGAVQWNPLPQFQERFDYVHLRDKVSGFRASAGNREDNLFGGTLWWDVDRHLNLTSRFTSFSDQVRDVSFDSTLRFAERDLAFRFNFYRLLKGYDFRVIDFDATGIAGTYQPYTEISVNATKGLGPHWYLDGGFAMHFLDTPQIASAFNHSYDRGYLSVSTADLLLKGLSLTTTVDYYHGSDNTLKNNTFGVSLVASQEIRENQLKVSGGTTYYLYRYNLFTGNESSDVQTYFARIQAKIFKNFSGRLGYEFEDNSVNNFHTVDLRLIWSF